MNESEKLQRLGSAERWIAGLFSVVGLFVCIWLTWCPPLRYTVVTDPHQNQTNSETSSDPSTVVVALLVASAGLLFYALNGLRLNKFSAGPISGESAPTTGSTRPPSPTAPATAEGAVQGAQVRNEQLNTFTALTELEKKILRTLWRYQTTQFQNYQQRWTFRLTSQAPGYSEYLTAIVSLLRRGLVFVTAEGDQCGLTNEGIVMMEALPDDAKRGEFYSF